MNPHCIWRNSNSKQIFEFWTIILFHKTIFYISFIPISISTNFQWISLNFRYRIILFLFLLLQHANESHYFSGRALGSCIIYHQLTCRNSMIICTHSKSQAIFTRPDYNINLFPSHHDFHATIYWLSGILACRFSHFPSYDDDKVWVPLRNGGFCVSIPLGN